MTALRVFAQGSYEYICEYLPFLNMIAHFYKNGIIEVQTLYRNGIY